MAVINPRHLLEQANALVSSKRKPRQVDLRRAVSNAYYAVFHQLLTAASDEFVGRTLRQEKRYALVYRSIGHATARRVCEEAARSIPTAKYQNFVNESGFETRIRRYAANLVMLQAKRNEADYDPSHALSTVDAMFAIYLAKTAIDSFVSADSDERKLFLTLLLFPPR
jgi:uncharacterized protein (UPF0332 family)